MNHSIALTELIHQLKSQLKHLDGDELLHEQTVWWLLEALTGKTRPELIMSGIKVSSTQKATLSQWVDQLVNHHKPLAYIIGSVPFEDLEILCEPPILIPRPETEEWTIALIKQIKKAKINRLNILDLCSGTGCIALLLAKSLPKSHVVGTDISHLAVALAHKNQRHNHIANCTFILSDLFEQLSPSFTFDIIVSNPPYIDPAVWKSLAPSVKNWEDPHALKAENQGLALIEQIIKKAPLYIKPNNKLAANLIPQLVIEIGYDQGPAVAELLKQAGYCHITILKDSEGKDRVASARVN